MVFQDKTLLWIIVVIVFITLILNVFKKEDKSGAMQFGLPSFSRKDKGNESK